MYRDAPPELQPADPMRIAPGRGFGDAVVGGTTASRALDLFGPDGTVHPSAVGADIASISYAGNAAANTSRPSALELAHGLVATISFGPHQRDVYTTGGIRIRSRAEDVLATFGRDRQVFQHEGFETWRYVDQGIEFGIDGDDDDVMQIAIFPSRRKQEDPGGSVDPRTVEPGRGVRGAVLGGSTPREMLALLGDDAQIHPSGRKADVTSINYLWASKRRYEPDRVENRARPEKLAFRHGLLHAIHVGPYQSELVTRGGVRIRSPRSDVLATFGHDYQQFVYKGFDVLRYIGEGIELGVDNDGDFGVTSMTVFREQRF